MVYIWYYDRTGTISVRRVGMVAAVWIRARPTFLHVMPVNNRCRARKCMTSPHAEQPPKTHRAIFSQLSITLFPLQPWPRTHSTESSTSCHFQDILFPHIDLFIPLYTDTFSITNGYRSRLSFLYPNTSTRSRKEAQSGIRAATQLLLNGMRITLHTAPMADF